MSLNEGDKALAKLRTYSYMIFCFEILFIVNQLISKIIGMSEERFLYGLVALTFFQVTICILLIVKYVTTIFQNNKHKKIIIMYATRIRLILIANYVIMGFIVFNKAKFNNILLEKILVVMMILLLINMLRYLTILQRRNY